MFNRRLFKLAFSKEFGRQMRFIAGPRQSGKTWLSTQFLSEQHYPNLYYNWDSRNIREAYYQNPYFFQSDVFTTPKQSEKYWVCFDEIHKLTKWKDILKDVFDHFEKDIQFIITGSAKLDTFRQSGDSLAGRYFLFRLYPLMVAEILNTPFSTHCPTPKKLIDTAFDTYVVDENSLSDLYKFGGFPEPLLQGKDAFHARWQQDYLDRLIFEDLRDLTQIMTLDNIHRLLRILPQRIGSPLSINSLARDLEVSHITVKNYLSALELSYVLFHLKPYTGSLTRSIKKEVKTYYLDWTRLTDESKKFENFVAVQLKTWINLLQDSGHLGFDLAYSRTRDGNEIDFVILYDQLPWLFIEVKLSRGGISRHLYNASEKFNVPVIQLVKDDNIAEKLAPNIVQLSANRFLSIL